MKLFYLQTAMETQDGSEVDGIPSGTTQQNEAPKTEQEPQNNNAPTDNGNNTN